MSSYGRCNPVCYLKADVPGSSAHGPDLLGMTKLLTVFLAVALLTSSLLFVGAPSEATPLSSPSGSDQNGSLSNAGHSEVGRSQTWNWTTMEDQSGYVSVILWENDFQPIQRVVDRLEGKHDSGVFLDDNDSNLQQHAQIKNKFTTGFEGLSVKITPDALDLLLASEPALEAYPDLPVQAMDLKTDQQIGADVMWSRLDGNGKPIDGRGITVAVIDTGICYTHPDLGGGFGSGYKVCGGFDFYNNDSDPMDDNGHGTHVAGIISANGGIKGVAPGSSLLAYKALGPDGGGTMTTVILSINAAIDLNGDGSTSDHANVISMSLGGQGDPNDPICLAVKRAVAAGVVVVVAAGNSGPSMGTVMSPGVSPYAITVGAVNDTGVLANFSSRGPTNDLQIKPEISAPGVHVLSTVPYSGTPYSSPTGYLPMSGTSMATPHISGAVALLLQAHSGWTPLQVESTLVTGANQLGNAFWNAGAGEVWIPASADVSLMSPEPLTSLGIFNGTAHSVSVYNSKQDVTLSVSSSDWNSLSADTKVIHHEWYNLSTVSPASITIASKGSGEISVSVSVSSTCAEGYYDGFVTLTSGSSVCRLPFAFLVMSRVDIHVINAAGREVSDPFGGVWLYSYPGAEIAFATRAGNKPSPPATYLLPSGQYAVHAAGNQLIYASKTPYLLSAVFTVGRVETREVDLNMSDAHATTIDLETEQGNPIYVREFRLYARHTGANNISFDLTGSDTSISGSGLFSLPHSATVYVSDTDASVGFSICGYAYSLGMWNFMALNSQHWYESISSLSTKFKIPATADLQYLLAWEFLHVNSSFPSVLSYDMNSSSVYLTKYDIPGTIQDPWCNWGTQKPIGGVADFWMRRDTYTSVNPFFSGMTRTVIVNGVFCEQYYPQNLFSGYLEREFYVPDYSHILRAASSAEVYLPDRNFIMPALQVSEQQRIGAGPFYPSMHTANTNNSLILFQPLLRDQWDSKVGGMNEPTMNLYRNGIPIASYQLVEYLAMPDAERVFSLAGSGRYSAQIDYSPFSELFNQVLIDLSFSVPSSDPDPPIITGFTMPQRFVPGDKLALSLSAEDARSSVSVSMSSRAGDGAPWVALKVNTATPGTYTATVSTSTTDSVVDLKITVKDSSGNYLNYTAYKVAQKETPVLFDIKPSVTEFEFSSTNTTVVLTGYLTNSSGGPLHPSAGVPLELWANGRKIGMVLDEYVYGTSHQHNGTIRFDWVLRPTDIFSAANQTVDITVSFDLGTYSPVVRTFSLHSNAPKNAPPVIKLLSPTNGSLIAAGTPIDLSVTDDGTIASSGYSVDGSAHVPLSSPWRIGTSGWSEGTRNLSVFALDDCGANASAKFSFELDALAPALTIVSPLDDSIVATGSTLVVNVYDAHLTQVNFSLDGGQSVVLPSPYIWNMTSWPLGSHIVVVRACDSVGHVAAATTTFAIVDNRVIISVKSPADASVTKSGVSIVLDIISLGIVTCFWSEYGVSHSLSAPYQISTTGWTEGDHQITISAANNLGGQGQIGYSITIDDTPPTMTLVSPSIGSYVTPEAFVNITAVDPYFDSISWTVSGFMGSSTQSSIAIQLASVTSDGPFTITVVSTDSANNTATQQFAFNMDCSCPRIWFTGASGGSPIAPGDLVILNASDAYLAQVLLSVDTSNEQTVSVPCLVNTTQLASGWHLLEGIATDLAGHMTSVQLSVYVDEIPPTVSMQSGTYFQNGSSFIVSASVSDNFGVEGATLHYTLPTGGVASVPMSAEGASFDATLSADQLWSGMTVYVVASDVVGHEVEGEHQTLREAVSPPTSGGDDGGNGGFHLLSSSAQLEALLIVVAISFALIIVMLALRRKKPRDGRDHQSIHVSVGTADGIVSSISLRSTKPATRGSSAGQISPGKAVLAAQASVSPAVAYGKIRPLGGPTSEIVSPLNAILEFCIRPSDAGDDEIDAFQAQIEDFQRAMVTILNKRSVYTVMNSPAVTEIDQEAVADTRQRRSPSRS